MAEFILIHGSCHGGWCWDRLVPLLEAQGHKVTAPDLPGHGADKTPAKVITLNDYTSLIGRLLEAAEGPVILAGHSLGGISISQAAEYWPDRISRLIYIAALLLPDGESRSSAREREPADSRFVQLIRTDEEEGYLTIAPEGTADSFYNDCQPEDIAWAQARLCPEPLVPLRTPLSLSAAGFGSVSRAYIHCSKDQTVLPETQARMREVLPCDPVIEMPSSHSPFLSMPQELAAHLHKLA